MAEPRRTGMKLTVMQDSFEDNTFILLNTIVYGVTFEAAFCTIIPGLTSRQREMCRTSPDAMVAVGDGIRLATNECRYQFRHQRWNCTGIENPSSFGHVVIVD
ncbi:hypothetical protein NQ318_007261 [Aromia moschata]|uniref:Protein Wnt n=1 Tax=Aromia moschata TaxID=1265417 RepID=A0AAV8XVT4_9CUCU|nr:hypothetical protein NQ318_007261 [Aromia moschata]